MKFKTLAITFIFAMTTAGAAFGAAAVGTGWVTQAADGTVTFPANTTNGPQITFKPSANVSMAYDCSLGTVYTIGGYHSSGTKVFGTSSTDAKIYMYDLGAAPGAVAPSVVIPAASAIAWGAGWTALK